MKYREILHQFLPAKELNTVGVLPIRQLSKVRLETPRFIQPQVALFGCAKRRMSRDGLVGSVINPKSLQSPKSQLNLQSVFFQFESCSSNKITLRFDQLSGLDLSQECCHQTMTRTLPAIEAGSPRLISTCYFCFIETKKDSKVKKPFGSLLNVVPNHHYHS